MGSRLKVNRIAEGAETVEKDTKLTVGQILKLFPNLQFPNPDTRRKIEEDHPLVDLDAAGKASIQFRLLTAADNFFWVKFDGIEPVLYEDKIVFTHKELPDCKFPLKFFFKSRKYN